MTGKRTLLWGSILLAAAWLLWRRHKRENEQMKHYPNIFDDDTPVTPPRRVLGVDVGDPFGEATGVVILNGQGKVVEVMQFRPGELKARERSDKIFGGIQQQIDERFDEWREKRQRKMQTRADEYDQWRAAAREKAFSEFRNSGFYDDLSDPEVYALVDRSEDVYKKVYGNNFVRLLEGEREGDGDVS